MKVPAATDYTITTMEAINATGVLTAVIDKPNHVSVRPVNPLEMMEDHVMSKLIDNLIKKYEYNIYINENISGEKLDKLALLVCRRGLDKGRDLLPHFIESVWVLF